jgi:hypothetical protein
MWVKVGGDMGGGTFKMCFQLCNTVNPNSPQNTCVFSIFEAPDTYTNVWIALDRFREQILSLETHTWRSNYMFFYILHTPLYVEARRYVYSYVGIISSCATCLEYPVLQVMARR